MVSDRDRHDLHVALLDRLGQGPANTMRELLPPVGWAGVARPSDLAALRAELKAEIASLPNQLFASDVATATAVAGLALAAARLA